MSEEVAATDRQKEWSDAEQYATVLHHMMDAMFNIIDSKMEEAGVRGEPEGEYGVFYDPFMHRQRRVGWYAFVVVDGKTFASSVDADAVKTLPLTREQARRIETLEFLKEDLRKVALGQYKK